MKFKHFFKNLFSGITLKIKSGPLKGKKWIATSGLSFIRGDFEPYKTKAFLDSYKPGMVLYDIGAHIGYFSIMASAINQAKGQIYSFEPRPSNRAFFEKHAELNGASDIKLFPYAVGDKEGKVRFNTHAGSATGHVSESGNIELDMINIDNWINTGKLPSPDYIKIDVEGGEIDVLKGCQNIIETKHPILLVATHSIDLHTWVCNFLDIKNYKYKILNPDFAKGDTEIIAHYEG